MANSFLASKQDFRRWLVFMAITKIRPIKSTLNLAIDYIVNGDKTDEQILVSTHNCPYTIFKDMKWYWNKWDYPCKTSHSILFNRRVHTWNGTSNWYGAMWKDTQRWVWICLIYSHRQRTYSKSHHLHNVNMVTGKYYQSKKRSYHQIKYQSDKLCRENNLSVIDEFYESYKKNIRLTVNLGMKTNRQSMGLIRKVSFNLTLTEW